MIKCKTDFCKNNQDGKCILKDIEIRYNYDLEISECANYEMSKEHMRNFYKIVPLEGIFVVLQTCPAEYPAHYVKSVVEDIREQYPHREEITIIFDSLLSCYNARNENRFTIVKYSCDKKDIIDWERLKNDYNCKELKPIFEITCNFLRDEYKIGVGINQHGFISKEATQMILNGMNI